MQYYLSRNCVKYVILSQEGGKEEGCCCKTAFLGASLSAKAPCKADKYVIEYLHPTKNVCNGLSFPFLKVQHIRHHAKTLFSHQLLSILRDFVSSCRIAAFQRQLKGQMALGWNKLLFLHMAMVREQRWLFLLTLHRTYSNFGLSNAGEEWTSMCNLFWTWG